MYISINMFFQLAVYLLGNSMVKLFSPSGFDHVECHPGADWCSLFQMIIERQEELRNSMIYVLVGPTPLTTLDKASGEVSLNTDQVYMPYDTIRRILKREMNIIIILCTCTPLNFEQYNYRCGRMPQLTQEEYQQITNFHVDQIIELNKAVIEANSRAGVITPFVHKSVLNRNPKNQSHRFRTALLRDGLHPSPNLIKQQEKELQKNLKLNLLKIISDNR